MDRACCSDILSINIKTFRNHKPATDVHRAWIRSHTAPFTTPPVCFCFPFSFFIRLACLSCPRTFLPWKEKYNISPKKKKKSSQSKGQTPGGTTRAVFFGRSSQCAICSRQGAAKTRHRVVPEESLPHWQSYKNPEISGPILWDGRRAGMKDEETTRSEAWCRIC